MGRLEKPIDWNLVDKYIEAGSNQKQICAAFHIDPKNFQDRFFIEHGKHFTLYAPEHSCKGEADLLLSSHARALKGNVQMLIYLRKHRLKEKEIEDDQIVPREEILLLEDQLIKLKEKLRLKDNEPKPEAGTQL